MPIHTHSQGDAAVVLQQLTAALQQQQTPRIQRWQAWSKQLQDKAQVAKQRMEKRMAATAYPLDYRY